MSSIWPKTEDSFSYNENIKAGKFEDVIVIDDNDRGDSLWRRRVKSEPPEDKPCLSPQDANQKRAVKEGKEMSRRARARVRAKKIRKAEARAAKSMASRNAGKKAKKLKKQNQAELKNASEPKKAKGSKKASTPKMEKKPNNAKSSSSPKAGKPIMATSDNLTMALVDELHEDGRLLNERWQEIEAQLAYVVTDRLMAMPRGPVPSFDSSEVIRGHRVIQCEDGFSKVFLANCVATISNTWDDMRIKLVHVSDVPFMPQVRIWLPTGQTDYSRIMACLRAQNLDVDMSDWSVLRAEEVIETSQSFLLLINRRCIPQLNAADYKLRYGIRMAQIQLILSEADDSPSQFDNYHQFCRFQNKP
ncbi:uncharacterized protein LOC6730118 [Drosophila simulans]|uniref:uncharacterized protein LOC6730118 n=1 Tax=Drosophila simulans TaxID=7240 RepID=UPI00078AECD0|nr:uncharacterized protein LOC6730118 [Drosophila simulans]KMZ06694.1 uncharacterized protein Dsimw501_GD17623 [Drosophila simulans]